MFKPYAYLEAGAHEAQREADELSHGAADHARRKQPQRGGSDSRPPLNVSRSAPCIILPAAAVAAAGQPVPVYRSKAVLRRLCGAGVQQQALAGAGRAKGTALPVLPADSTACADTPGRSCIASWTLRCFGWFGLEQVDRVLLI